MDSLDPQAINARCNMAVKLGVILLTTALEDRLDNDQTGELMADYCQLVAPAIPCSPVFLSLKIYGMFEVEIAISESEGMTRQ